MALVERSTKAGWLSLKGLRKQDGFRWKLYESKMAFFESSTKARLLSLKALRMQDGFRWKPFKMCVNRDITKFRDKIAYVGGPSFRRRPWPFGERCSRARATSATLIKLSHRGHKLRFDFYCLKKTEFLFWLFIEPFVPIGLSATSFILFRP